MADEDKEKAEKLAAAKKRFEQLKKEQQKKSKKTAAKKKDESTAKAEDDTTASEAIESNSNAVEDGQSIDGQDGVQANGKAPEEGTGPSHIRQPSVSVQSRQRSESFKQGNAATPSPGEVQDVNRNQAAQMEALEKENQALRDQQEDGASRLAKAEEEAERLRDASTVPSNVNGSTQDVGRLQAQLETTQRQLLDAQQLANGVNGTTSASASDVSEQLASKISSIESLELELSNLRNQTNGLQSTLSERDSSAKELEDRAKAAETATDSVRQELDALKVSISFPSDDTKAANEDPEALTKRITLLESDLRTANSNLDAAAKRATSLEQKIEALTKLHRDATTTSQARDRELTELRSQLGRRDRPSHVRDASEFELGEEETETGALQSRIRGLEAENFDLRRNVWREKRAEMQPGMEDDTGHRPEAYEDVDLNSPYGAGLGRKGSGPKPVHSSFQDVITSGLSAFTGRSWDSPQRGAGYAPSPRARKQSLALLSEAGDDFDPDAFRLAQEEDAKRRVERVKEVKRGLEKWKGWRLDLTEMRQNVVGGGREFGPVFEL